MTTVGGTVCLKSLPTTRAVLRRGLLGTHPAVLWLAAPLQQAGTRDCIMGQQSSVGRREQEQERKF